ncbi:MAG TPA: putative toxin-antitoxin system toxin component, PIN family [Gammaproteobacteria bacterium]|nr:putative toxin-antitoxin system toxin component, PIN family [Gammaproteobacteria bacterium]
MLEEYDRVSKQLSEKYPAIDLSAFIELLTIKSELHIAEKLHEPVSCDPDDDKFVACAISSRVKIIISGDKDLLDISGYQGISVIKPAAFVKQHLE